MRSERKGKGRRWIAIMAVVVTSAVAGAAAAGTAYAEEEGYRYKCHQTQQGCEQGRNLWCDVNCGTSGCKCAAYDAMV